MIAPYASGRTWRLYRGDALAILPHLDPVDGVVTDPPYSSGGMVRGDRAGQSARKKYASSDSGIAELLTGFSGDNRDQRAYLAWCALWLGMCLDLVPEGAPLVCFSDWRQLPTTTDAIQVGGWVWRGIVPWCKINARPQRGQFAAAAEFAAWGTAGPATGEGACLPGYYLLDDGAPIADGAEGPPPYLESLPPRGADKTHITQKELEITRRLVRIVRPGGVVLDPFCGSGTTGEASILEGRGFIGIEKEPAHLDTAACRLTDAEAGVPGRKVDREGRQRALWGGGR